jgi:hypothetical protein
MYNYVLYPYNTPTHTPTHLPHHLLPSSFIPIITILLPYNPTISAYMAPEARIKLYLVNGFETHQTKNLEIS